ncbi:hypothetical protein NDU88_005162 [Pleurodeles waltl]|uniref:Uncharacterized protein n=1 Tax=Pleurodeles waltl TaxID=8319 RepID=A0AAV7LM05_PLEWA|nr:hypothetical protein NDU88_005162 [Pleurodeles waltl]
MNCSPEPAEAYAGGTLWRSADPEVISNTDIRDPETGDMREKKPEGAGAVETEEEERNERENERGTEPKTEGGTKSEEEEDDREDAGEGRKEPDSAGSLGDGTKTPTEIQRRHGQAATSPEGRGLHRYDRTLG